MSAKADATKIIAAFAARTNGAHMWKTLDRAKVAAGAIARINNPDLIDQQEASVCGPACFVHAVATDAPRDYAQAIVDLYENGWACLGGRAQCLMLRPSTDLMNYTLPATAAIDPADWIILASVRDTENWFYRYSSIDYKWRAGTKPHELANWFRETGYTDVQDHTGGVFLASYPVVWAEQANGLFVKGYKVGLEINVNMLEVATQDDDSWTANHLVGLTAPFRFNHKHFSPFKACYYEGRHRECSEFAGGYDAASSTVSFRVYTWGQDRPVPKSGTLSVKSFMKNFYGFVAGKY